MYPGFLLVTNNVDPAYEEEFNAWYQGEHLSERLGVPGFITGQRYVALDAPQRYAALYETRTPEVLVSPAYAARLGSPTPRTTAIMPGFHDMTRAIGRLAFKEHRSIGGVIAIVFIAVHATSDDDAQRIGEMALDARGAGALPEAVRVVVSAEDRVGTDTPESKLRPGGDRGVDTALIVEWLNATSADLHSLRTALVNEGWNVERDRGGLYRLLCARRNAEAA